MKPIRPKQRLNFSLRFNGKLALILLAAIFFSLFHFSVTICVAKDAAPKRVLVIYTYHEGLPWERLLDDSLRATLASKSTEPIELNVEHSDRVRYPGDAHLQNFIDLLRHKYSHPKMDAVIGVDDEATDILLKYGDELFPRVPIVFLNAERKTLQRDSLKPNMTSLLWGPDFQGTADLIYKMLPKTRQIFIISGSSLGDRAAQNLARNTLRGGTNQLKNQMEAETAYLQEEIKLEHDFESIIGNSPAIQHVLFKVGQVADTDTTVLVLGETGTGKELVSRAIHSRSIRNQHPLVKVNCAALPQNLIESELFGHEPGAFTGAATRQIGRFEVADGTSVFLDEIGELPLELQTKLLQVLQDGEFERLGSSRTIKVNVRVIAATNRDLDAEVRKGRFWGGSLLPLECFSDHGAAAAGTD